MSADRADLHVDERPDGSFAFFIEGDLQFDSRDEALYHECLALPPLALADKPRRLLICGGGDGLALRECLRFPGIDAIDLVDCDAGVLELGRTRFAELNQGAFLDPRVSVYVEDAWSFLAQPRQYDSVLCDFTVPRRPGDDRVFTVEWYERVRAALTPGGVAAFNAVSPQATPEAFWCLRRTVRAAGLSALPYRVCIPSFRDQGYGAWGFFLAARRPLRAAELQALRCPLATHQADLSRLWRGARFTRHERALEASVSTNTLANPRLLPLMLNPGSGELNCQLPIEPAGLLDLIPITHPYHTREMIETLAQQVAGAVRALDIRRLVEALLRRAAELPGKMVAELRKLRDFLRENAPDAAALQRWGYRLFAALVITMTLANAVCPDNAFAKGSHGLGHASMSRGYSGGFFGGRGSAHTSGTSRSGGFFGGGSPRVSGTAFRGSYRRGGMVDIYGTSYRPRYFYYYGGSSYHGHTGYVTRNTSRPSTSPEKHEALFVADDDMMVMDTGDVIITLSDRAFLLVTGGTVALLSDKLGEPLLPVYPDPNLFKSIRDDIDDQRDVARGEAKLRRDWLDWVGWTSALFPIVRADRDEARNLEDLDRRLGAALTTIGQPPANATPAQPLGVELFAGCFLQQNGIVAIRQPDSWLYTDGKQIWTDAANAQRKTCPPELADGLRSIMEKLQKELAADIRSDTSDLRTLDTDLAAMQRDLAEYNRYYSYYGAGYEVDYGTDTISAADAVMRTERDIADNRKNYNETNTGIHKSESDLATLNNLLPGFGH